MRFFKRLIEKLLKYMEPKVDLYQGLNIGPGTHWSIANLDGIAPQLITIGRDCMITPRAMILTHDASFFIHTKRYRFAPVKIGDRVFIGYGAIIMPGVTIGENSIVGAGAVVTRDVPGNTVVTGVPATVLCSTSELMARERQDLFELPETFAHQVTHALPITQNDILNCQQHLLGLINPETVNG
jgi:acetyltransferase-like isoleucine patch superfamily enzyme